MPNISPQKQLSFEFSPHNFPVQIEIVKGEPVFLAKDVCDILDLENVTKALYTLDEDEKLTLPVVRAGQTREMNFVTESGLYGLIFQSRKPEAKKFRKWVTNEVLPSIRKTGSYSLANKKASLTVQQIEELLKAVDTKEYNGQVLYPSGQLRIVLGKSKDGIVSYMRDLAKEGLAFKLPIIDGEGRVQWYVPRKAIGRLLNLRPNSIAKIAISNN